MSLSVLEGHLGPFSTNRSNYPALEEEIFFKIDEQYPILSTTSSELASLWSNILDQREILETEMIDDDTFYTDLFDKYVDYLEAYTKPAATVTATAQSNGKPTYEEALTAIMEKIGPIRLRRNQQNIDTMMKAVQSRVLEHVYALEDRQILNNRGNPTARIPQPIRNIYTTMDDLDDNLNSVSTDEEAKVVYRDILLELLKYIEVVEKIPRKGKAPVGPRLQWRNTGQGTLTNEAEFYKELEPLQISTGPVLPLEKRGKSILKKTTRKQRTTRRRQRKSRQATRR